MTALKRKPNTVCKHCGTPVYRRPKATQEGRAAYCSLSCYHDNSSPEICQVTCQQCGNEFDVKAWQHKRTPRRFCGKRCVAKSRTGEKRPRTRTRPRNTTKGRLEILQNQFAFTSCMVEGCEYSKTYDVHRFVPGRDGGKYEVGNMFAICPGHHAEITRKIICVEKVNDCCLRVVQATNTVSIV